MAFLSPPPSFSSPASPTPPHGQSNLSLPTNHRRYRHHHRRHHVIAAFSLPHFFNRFSQRTIQFNSITTEGRRKLPQHVIDQHLLPLQNKRITIDDIEQALKPINHWYRHNEYVCSYVVMSNNKSLFQSKVLSLICVEPILDSIQLKSVDREGNLDSKRQLTTRLDTICRALGLKIGQIFSWRTIGIQRLMSLGLFSYADAQVNILSNEKVTLVLRLCERRARFVEPGAGVASDGRMFGDVSVVDNNFMGRAQRLRLEWQKRLDAPRPAGGFAFEDMRIGAYIPLSFRLRAYRDCNSVVSSASSSSSSSNNRGDNEVIGESDHRSFALPLRYEKDRDGILVDLGYRPRDDSNLLFNFTPMFEHVYANGLNRPSTTTTTTTTVNAPNNTATENSTASTPSTTPLLQAVLQTGFTHATRRPVELPRSGHVVRIEHTFGSPLRVEPNLFHRVKLKVVHYFGIAARCSLAAKLIAGLGSDNLPWHEQRALGGHATVRGYRYGQLGRYKSYATGRLELRVPLAFSSSSTTSTNTTNEDESANTTTTNENNNNSGNKENQQNGYTPKVTTSTDSSTNTTSATAIFDRIPALVGVLFADAACKDVGRPELAGASYGIGVRVGGIIAVDWTTTIDGRPSRVHFSLVDQSM